jgi:chaperonin GroES
MEQETVELYEDFKKNAPQELDEYECTGDRVILKRIDHDDEYVKGTGLVKPQSSRQKSNIGIICFVKPGEDRFKPGDTVVFSKYGGTDLEVNGVELLIMHRDNVYARLKPKEAS